MKSNPKKDFLPIDDMERELLELFKTASESGFKALVESLSEAKQGHLAQNLQKTRTDLEESELGSDFEGK